MPRRYFIQHMGGDPFALRFVLRDSPVERDATGWEVQWTEDPEQRHEWDIHSEAKTLRDELKIGIVLGTEPPETQADPDEEAKQQKRRHLPEPEIPIDERRPFWWEQQ